MSVERVSAGSAPPAPGTPQRALFELLAKHDRYPGKVSKADMVNAAFACGVELGAGDTAPSKNVIAQNLRSVVFGEKTAAPVVREQPHEEDPDADAEGGVRNEDEPEEGEEPSAERTAAVEAPPVLPPVTVVTPGGRRVAAIGMVNRVVQCCGQRVRIAQGAKLELTKDAYDYLLNLKFVKPTK